MSSRITVKTVNNKMVKAVTTPPEKQGKKVLGGELFKDPFSNVFICAKKKSGKTTVIDYILEETVGPETTVIFFVSTLYRDKTYKQILKKLKARGVEVIEYTSLIVNGVNQLHEFCDHLEDESKKENELEEQGPIPKKNKVINVGKGVEEDDEMASEKRRKKSKYIYPRYTLVLDDLGKMIRNDAVGRLFRMGRHPECRVICSSQAVKDMAPDAMKNVDYFLIFQKIPIDKLEHIYREADLHLPFNVFLKLYKITTKEKYNFLYIDTQDDTYRKNFDQEYDIPNIF